MLSKMKISVGTDVENPTGSSLRDFVLHKHFSIAEGTKLKSYTANKTNPSINDLDKNKKGTTQPKNKKKEDTFFNKNFLNLIKSNNPTNALNPSSNRSNNNNNNEFNNLKKENDNILVVEDKLKLVSLRSLSNIGNSNIANPVNPMTWLKPES